MSKRAKRPKSKSRPSSAAKARPATSPAALAAAQRSIDAALKGSYERLQKGQYEKAEQILRKALQEHPREPRLMANLVATFENLGRMEEAQRGAEAAVKWAPEDPQSRNNLGAILKFQGDLERAREQFQKAVDLAPEYAAAWRNLVGLKRFESADDPDVAALETLLEKIPRNHETKAPTYFALGKVYEDLGDVEKSFAHYERGNRHKRARLNFRMEDLSRIIDETMELHTAEHVNQRPVPGASEDAPVLISGMPRSGSTLIEQILSSHPLMEGVGEVQDLPRSVESFVDDARFRTRTIAGLEGDQLAKLGKAYALSLRKRAPKAARISDKYLTNFVHFGTVRRALPNAKFIYARRGPMANGFACFKTLFTTPLPYVYDLKEIAAAYKDTDRLMRHWQEVMPESILEVNYEELVTDQEGQTRRMLEFLGLPWDDACMNFHETKRRVNSASSTQVRRPMYSSSVEGWKAYETHLAPLAEAFGDMAR